MYLEALLLKYKSEIATATANINNYLVNGVGVAEHPDVVLSLSKLVGQVATAKEQLLVVEEFLILEVNKRIKKENK